MEYLCVYEKQRGSISSAFVAVIHLFVCLHETVNISIFNWIKVSNSKQDKLPVFVKSVQGAAALFTLREESYNPQN